MGVPALRREHVHLPRILPELDTRGARGRLALVDECMHEVSELALGEMVIVRKPCESRHRVDGGVEDQLRPLCGPQVVEGLRLQTG